MLFENQERLIDKIPVHLICLDDGIFKNVAVVHWNCFEFTIKNTDNIKFRMPKCLPVVVVLSESGIEVEI